MAFTRKPAGDGFLVSTNFNLANPANGTYPCWRYDAGERAAEGDRQHRQNSRPSARPRFSTPFTSHLPAVWTIMSVVGDLPQGLVYVYLFHQFDAPIVLNVADEIARAPDPGPLRDLFPQETVRRVDQAYQRMTARSARCDAVGLTWLGLVAVSLVALLLLARSAGQGLVFWVPVVAVLGPVGLLVWRVTASGRRAGLPADRTADEGPAVWKRSLVETVGDLPPYLIGLVLGLLAIVSLPEIGQSASYQLLIDYGFPLAIGVFLYQGPLQAWATHDRYLRVLWRRLPATIISTNLALTGLLAAAFPLISLFLKNCPIGGPAVLLWWIIAVLGGLAGGSVLYVYHRWAVQRGFVAWSALLWGRDEEYNCEPVIASPTWRRVWIWLLVSFVVLVAGIALGAMGGMLVEGYEMKAGSGGGRDISTTFYRIRVKGRLDERWSDWFNGFTISYPAQEETLLSGPVRDQAALHGMLTKIRDLGLSLLSIDRVERRT